MEPTFALLTSGGFIITEELVDESMEPQSMRLLDFLFNADRPSAWRKATTIVELCERCRNELAVANGLGEACDLALSGLFDED